MHITFLALHAGSADIYLMIHKSSIFLLLLRITFLISIWWYIKFESNKNYATQNLPKKYHMWLIKAQFLYSITFLLRWPKIFLHKLFLCILSHIYYILQCDYLPETISRSKLCNTKMVIEYVRTLYIRFLRLRGPKNFCNLPYPILEALTQNFIRSKSCDTKTPLYDLGIEVLIFYLNFFSYLL